MMRFTKTTLLAALIAVLLMASGASAQMGCCPGGAGKGAAAWADLTPDQQNLAKKRIELMELASKEKPDEQAIEKKRKEIWDLQDAMRNERRSMATKFRALLTPDQKQKLGPMGFGFGGMGPGGFCGFGGDRGCGGCAGRMSRL
jgi:Spy/CpxP family protein refolding chaperone